ncbi:unnamed protein product [Notodromas monacha]|uniref:Uncharacterized protein n=1 Tax=Notodromas monacha TaxID=399045 RepID=A0A7R9GLK4_9CRUS|nr:unnamed protein product [Notodromas monacha]CAG0925797.1 unnamed protein product [Notodromas monacha]
MKKEFQSPRNLKVQSIAQLSELSKVDKFCMGDNSFIKPGEKILLPDHRKYKNWLGKGSAALIVFCCALVGFLVHISSFS